MKIIRNLDDTSLPQETIAAWTIGNFDGVHKGHQAVLSLVKELAGKSGGPSMVMTFENHPAEILKPGSPICCICTLTHKIKLLEHFGIDILLLLPFTKELSEHTAEVFLQKVRKVFPFFYLVLGYDAVLGKDRQGDRQQIQTLAQNTGFQVEYLNEFTFEGIKISSSTIRNMIREGLLQEASKLLGRPYSIFSKVISGKGKGKLIGFPTANVDVQGLCLPPLGVYAVRLKFNGIEKQGVANLGFAPSLRDDPQPLLEVHLFDYDEDLYNQEIEVFFSQYLRPEQKFSDVQALKEQIQTDVLHAKKLFAN